MDRRTFLSSLAAASVAVACSSDDDDATTTGSRSTRVRLATPKKAPDLAAGSFALGVASGDPTPDKVLLWTRLASEPKAVGGGSPTTDVEVAYDVATDAAFEKLVASGVVTATAERAHAVHVDVTNLDPDTWYHYRFRAGDQTSPVGRTRTLPAADAAVDRFTFVFASCQDYQWGRYGAWKHASEEPDLDLVVFLGDYIYEITLGDLSPEKSGDRVWANAETKTLDDYRVRYAQTKSDLQLQAAHQAAPWVTMFDDHEVSNNYAGDVGQADGVAPGSHERRLAAYQAWYEHTPIRVTPEPDSYDSLVVHRSIPFGRLASMFAIETRQHADPPACRGESTGGGVMQTANDQGPDCADRNREDRTNLGAEQEAFLLDGLRDSDATWNIIANPVMMAGLNLGTPEAPEYQLDAWDGYPAARNRLLDRITGSKVSNPVVVTGDWHASFVMDVKRTPDGPTIMPEFLAGSITTVSFATDYRAANPHVRYFATDHCYGLVTVTAAELRCEFKYVADVWDANTAISKVDGWKVTAGDHIAQPV
ncbi:MAG: alkaline phosphatase D family protein [Acidimicrobiales bacterium]